MATYNALFGANNTRLGVWESNWLAPILASTSGLSLTRVTGSDVIYYTSPDPFTLPAQEYPTHIKVEGYLNGQWYCSDDDYDSTNPASADIYLCFRSGANAYETKKLGTITLNRGASSTVNYSWDVPNGQSLAGQTLYLYVTGARGIWFSEKEPSAESPSYLAMTITTTQPYTACGVPSNVSLSAASNGSATLSWNAGSAGTNNAVSGYQIQRATSADNSSWSAWSDVNTVNSGTLQQTVSATYSSSTAYIKYRVRTLGVAGDSYASSYVESNSISTNTSGPTFTVDMSMLPTSAQPYLKGIHSFTATITNATATYPKTIKSYSISSPFGSSTSTTYTSGVIQQSGTFTVTFKVTDSSDITTTQTRTFIVRDYSPPTVDAHFERCDADLGDNPLGTSVRYTATASCATISNYINYITSVTFVINSSNSSKTGTLTTTGDTTRLSYYDSSGGPYGYTQDKNIRCDIVVTVSDRFSSTTVTFTIPTANYAIYLNDNGTAIGFGTVTQHDNSVEIDENRTLYAPNIISSTNITYTNLTQTSSRTIKHDIEPLGDYGAAIDALEPVTFVYDSDESEQTHVGLIYEDTVDVLPAICTKEERGQTISYIELVPILLKEIQSLRARLTTIEGKVT